MEDAIIRWIEYWLGRPLCALLTVHRRVVDWIEPAPSAAPPERILFIKLIEQGSTVLASAALQRAIDLVGRANVYFCVFEENRAIVDILGLLPTENIISIRADRMHRFAMDSLRVLRKMRRLKIDATVDLEGFARASAILAYLSGATRRAGLHRFTIEAQYRGDLMTHRVAYNPYVHTSRAFSLLVESLTRDPREVPMLKVVAGDAEEELPRLRPTEEERGRVEKILQDVAGGRVDGPIVLLNPNAHDRLPLRKWPTDRFVELGQRLLSAHDGLTVAVTGAPSERAAAERACEQIGSPRAMSVAGRTTLRELLSLYDRADVLVTNDSGPAHFASMTNIDIVALFGPETPQLYGPLGPRSHVAWAGLACSPCVNVFNSRLSPCTDNRCMQEITVEQVYEAVERCLAAR